MEEMRAMVRGSQHHNSALIDANAYPSSQHSQPLRAGGGFSFMEGGDDNAGAGGGDMFGDMNMMVSVSRATSWLFVWRMPGLHEVAVVFYWLSD